MEKWNFWKKEIKKWDFEKTKNEKSNFEQKQKLKKKLISQKLGNCLNKSCQ